MNIRFMTLEDIPRIHEMEKEIFTDPWSENSLRESLEQKNTIMLTAENGREILGYLIVYAVLDECEIARIAAAKEFRRQGVGGQLILRLEKDCAERKITRILLDVRRGNQPASAFYRAQGFQEDGIRRNFYTKPTEDAVLMSKNLGK